MSVPVGSDWSLQPSGDWPKCVAKRVKPLIQLLAKQTIELFGYQFRDKVKATLGMN